MSVVKSKSKYQQRPIGGKRNTLKRQLSKARENASDHVAIGFSSVSDWMKEWRGFSGPITARSKANQNNSGLLSTLHRKLYY